MAFPSGGIFANSCEVFAQRCDSIRPGYPNEMFDDIKTAINISPAKTVLEIGSGSGITIGKLAEFGCHIIGIETGTNVAGLGKEAARGYTNVSIVETTFEQYQPDQSAMDVIIALTGFHWSRAQDKYSKVLGLLAERGSFTLIWNSFLQVRSELTFEIDKLYRKYLFDIYPPDEDDVNERVFRKAEHRVKEMLDHPDFLVCFLKRYFSIYYYDKTTYPELLNTFPKINNIEIGRREAFLNDVREAVSRYGEIAVPIMTVLLIAQKKASLINLVSSTSSYRGDK